MVDLLDQMCEFFQDSPDNALSLELTVMSFKALMWLNVQLWSKLTMV